MTSPNPPANNATLAVPEHDSWTVPWKQSYRAGSIEDRKMREVTTSVPPRLAQITLSVPNEVAVESERAVHAIAKLDDPDADYLRPLARLLLRAESVASSKIEHKMRASRTSPERCTVSAQTPRPRRWSQPRTPSSS